jgi:hypothetical protein
MSYKDTSFIPTTPRVVHSYSHADREEILGGLMVMQHELSSISTSITLSTKRPVILISILTAVDLKVY